MIESATTSGTLQDVATFFRRSARTVHQWTKEKRIAFWQVDQKLMFGEEAILDLWESGYVAARRMSPGETREIGRMQWRAHLALRDGKAQMANGTGMEEMRAALKELHEKVDFLERRAAA